MRRLNQRAFNILSTHTKECTQNDISGRVQRDIALKRLAKLYHQQGKPATASELRNLLRDVFPNFNPKVYQAAARANRPPGILRKLALGTVGVATLAGGLFVLNLPYPMIRKPVAKVAPMLLFPSYASMDYNYRQAIAKVEQADQLVNQATSAADVELGAQKVTEAQGHLDKLPVWFLGYSPQRYCTFMSCSWKFTLDEFEQARASVGRMEAQVFQENNALNQLEETRGELASAKQQYQQAKTQAERTEAIADWQGAIDNLQQVPQATLAGEMARTELNAQQRDFQEIVGYTSGDRLSGSLIQAAKEFGMKAAVAAQNPPHTEAEWGRVAMLWQEAIARLGDIKPDNPNYNDAQKLLADYTDNLAVTQIRQQSERASAAALQKAKGRIAEWQSLANYDSSSPRLVSQLQTIINELETVETGTTAYKESQQLLKFARNKLQALQVPAE